ncbi:MAG TPA: DUF6166 domain-containing protein [Verrucomicrobiae bacterium]|nr:DUF6166 domain-containing protein [Verrucomicrobiae bacterium]
MKPYVGTRTPHGVAVTVDGQPLDPRFDLSNHSPTGFEWGYVGSGPAQLALALVADHLGDDEWAIACHQDFRWTVVVKLPHSWTLTSNNIERVLQSLLGKVSRHV